MPTAAARLEPARDVASDDERFSVAGPDPWLRIAGVDLARLAGRLVEIVYRASLWDEPMRPVFRFVRGDGSTIDQIAAAPIAGAGVWIGRIPTGTADLWVGPTLRPGRFDFAVESLRQRNWAALLAEGMRRNARSTRSAVLTRLIGWAPESDNNLAWAIGAIPLDRFEAWWAERRRPLDRDGLDAPRFDWQTAPISLVVAASGAPDEAVARTLASLEAQVFPSWRMLLVGSNLAPRDSRVTKTDAASAARRLREVAQDELVGWLAAGDILLPEALAIVAEQAHRRTDRDLFYGDAIILGADDRRRPDLRPGWSPRLQAGQTYLLPPVFMRARDGWSDADRTAFVGSGVPASRLAEREAAVLPLRRILVEMPERRRGVSPPEAPRPRRVEARAAIIIPTRDHPALLERAVRAVRSKRGDVACEIVVVDNGSTTPEAKAQLDAFRASPDVVVLDHPGPFNFSRMCNVAAAAAHGDVLVFLNDDTEVLSADWLDRLCAHALDPRTGAVGARLTYPDGQLQHVGVLLGMGGSAGHFGAPAPGDDPGWAGRNLAVHEVSAVTGACLAVSRDKFEAVGGFDDIDLPIELSDIDLCLKLNARGFQTIVDPAVHIMHEESASRGGATLRRLAVHDRERAIFLERWRHVLRDDPVFHPGLSLYSWRAALG